MKKNKEQLTYGGKPHECYKVLPYFVVSYTPLSQGISICSECGMSVDSEEDKKHYVQSDDGHQENTSTQ